MKISLTENEMVDLWVALACRIEEKFASRHIWTINSSERRECRASICKLIGILRKIRLATYNDIAPRGCTMRSYAKLRAWRQKNFLNGRKRNGAGGTPTVPVREGGK